MSLSETREILDIARQIMEILNNTNTAVATIETKTPVVRENLTNFRELERLGLRYLTISRRLGLPDDMARATTIVTEMIVMVRMLEISFNSLGMGPIRALIGIAGLIMVGLNAYDMARGGG